MAQLNGPENARAYFGKRGHVRYKNINKNLASLQRTEIKRTQAPCLEHIIYCSKPKNIISDVFSRRNRNILLIDYNVCMRV